VRYFTSSRNEPIKQSRLTPWVVGILVVGGLAVIARPTRQDAIERYNAAKKKAENAPKVFTGGDQGFVKLKLVKSADVNHNTKHLTFKFDDEAAVSGLTVACKLSQAFL
jgi:hypothetical protein